VLEAVSGSCSSWSRSERIHQQCHVAAPRDLSRLVNSLLRCALSDPSPRLRAVVTGRPGTSPCAGSAPRPTRAWVRDRAAMFRVGRLVFLLESRRTNGSIRLRLPKVRTPPHSLRRSRREFFLPIASGHAVPLVNVPRLADALGTREEDAGTRHRGVGDGRTQASRGGILRPFQVELNRAGSGDCASTPPVAASDSPAATRMCSA
jgi:hypothetical protein